MIKFDKFFLINLPKQVKSIRLKIGSKCRCSCVAIRLRNSNLIAEYRCSIFQIKFTLFTGKFLAVDFLKKLPV